MNRGQFQKYHVNRRQWEEARAARGLSYDAVALDALKHKQIGRVCSSKDFSQRDLDRMIAGFQAETRPADFDAQMEQQNQPEKRRALLEERCMAAGRAFITGNDEKHVALKTVSYLCGIAVKKGFPHRWPIADERQLRMVTIAIEQQAERERAKQISEEDRLAAVPADAADEEIAG